MDTVPQSKKCGVLVSSYPPHTSYAYVHGPFFKSHIRVWKPTTEIWTRMLGARDTQRVQCGVGMNRSSTNESAAL